jgi:hypothetical protein
MVLKTIIAGISLFDPAVSAQPQNAFTKFCHACGLTGEQHSCTTGNGPGGGDGCERV